MRSTRDAEFDESQPTLMVTYGNTPRKQRPLDRDIIVLGRGRGCDMALVSPEIAPVHCIVVRAAAGWLIRDGGSRAGTHVNGELITEAILRDGDTVQVGPFCFRAHLPDPSPAPSPATLEGGPLADDRTPARLRRSRRNLARLALSLRRRLRQAPSRERLDQLAQMLRERLHECEEWAGRLTLAERGLAVDREMLERESNALQERVLQAEQELNRRQADFEEGVRARWRHFQQLCQEAEQAHTRRLQKSASAAADSTVESRRLDLRQQELACFARHLRRAWQRLREQEEALTRQRKELEQTPGAAPRNDVPHVLEANCLCHQP